MAKSKVKYYTVWEGRLPGVYDNWEECQKQIKGFAGARFKSFPSKAIAEKAFNEPWQEHYGSAAPRSSGQVLFDPDAFNADIVKESICVDAACSGNPGIMEYRGVDLKTGLELFHKGPFQDATNNIGEFLAIVHGLALVKNYEFPMPIYSDSRTAISWVKQKKCKTKLQPNEKNAEVFNLILRAEKWLRENEYKNPVLKWETEIWGEIPADFGRK